MAAPFRLVSATTVLTGRRKEPPLFSQAVNSTDAGTSPGGAAQTYAVADYDSTGLFGSAALDNVAASHEVGEWANDPYVNNATSSWGHLGQVSGCQSNLEVGDPLAGTTFPVTIGRTTYHLQELAFFGWFFGYSGGVNGWYSTQGTFTSPSTLCSPSGAFVQ